MATPASLIGSVLAISAAAIAAAPAASPAQAQDTAACAERESILAQLSDRYSEAPVAMGLDGQGRMIEILSAPSGTWTILVSSPDGMSCLVASGVAFDMLVTPVLAGSPA